MPDIHPIEPELQRPTSRQSNSASCQQDVLSPSSTLSASSSNVSSTPSSGRLQHKRFFSLSGLENSSANVLQTIRSRSPLRRASTPVHSKDRLSQRKPSPSPTSAARESPIPRSSSPTEMSPTSSVASQHPSFIHSRVMSDGNASVSSSRSRSDSHKRYSGTLNHYGRHSNDWLFNGFSVRDTFRDGFEKLRGNHDRD